MLQMSKLLHRVLIVSRSSIMEYLVTSLVLCLLLLFLFHPCSATLLIELELEYILGLIMLKV